MLHFPRPRTLPHRALRALPVLLLLASLAVVRAATPASAASAPPGDAFYVPPNPLPAGSPGDVIWSRPSAAPLTTAKAWQVLYLSTTVQGTPTAVSGTVLVPTAPFPGTRPLVAYAAGTQGWGDQCAPSKSIAGGVFDELFAVDNLLAKGWAVVVTDYPGLGTPGPHLYNVGIAEGYAVLDSLRAAARLPEAGLSATAPVAIEGYSQGGGAADWAAQQQPRYAPELRLAGVAGGGTPADLQAVAANINGTVWFAFLGGSALGFDAAYPSVDLNRYLTDAGKAALAQLSQECQAEALLRFAGKRIEDYTTGHVNPIGAPEWKAALDANNLGTPVPSAPLLQFHGLVDEIIPLRVETSLHQRYCAAGVRTLLKEYAGGHVLTHPLAQADVVRWLRDRFAGAPAPRNC